MKTLVLLSTFVFSCTALASQNHPFYIAADGGIFQGSFNNQYFDQTDAIAQNFQQTVLQNGYTGGIALGYHHGFTNRRYGLGIELSGHGDTNKATFQEGASSAAFSDTTQINAHMDLTLVPTLYFTKSLNAFLKFGMSLAWIQDNLISPVGNTAAMTTYANSNATLGAALGLGIAKKIAKRFKLYTEADYHDYGTTHFPAFQNFTATYTHASHIYSYDVVCGAAYTF
ncbi:MAG: hypothetical protein Q8L78_01845 [Coxiellaceae bacterium]|nr:hypothetical protein [Coxiellaceae bacterium]